jgi:hypothetical protein
MKYPLTFYVDSLPPNVGGCANGPVIRILKKYKDVDEGIYQHELTHVKQWFFTLGLHSLFYLLFDSYKLWAEIEAYKAQAKHYPDDRRPLFARFISRDYDLDISESAALELLRDARIKGSQ